MSSTVVLLAVCRFRPKAGENAIAPAKRDKIASAYYTEKNTIFSHILKNSEKITISSASNSKMAQFYIVTINTQLFQLSACLIYAPTLFNLVILLNLTKLRLTYAKSGHILKLEIYSGVRLCATSTTKRYTPNC